MNGLCLKISTWEKIMMSSYSRSWPLLVRKRLVVIVVLFPICMLWVHYILLDLRYSTCWFTVLTKGFPYFVQLNLGQPLVHLFFSRFNIASDLIDQAKNAGQLGLAGILVWMRFMATRQLIWNKNYNVKPR